MELMTKICVDEIIISREDGTEVAKWIRDEWEEDPSLTPAIALAVLLAYTDPEKLIEMNKEYINNQLKIHHNEASSPKGI